MRYLLTPLVLLFLCSEAIPEEGVGDSFDISCIDTKRFVVTVSGAEEVYERGKIERFGKGDGAVQCNVGGENFRFRYMILEPLDHGECGVMPMLYFDLHLNNELKTEYGKFGSACFNSIHKLDVELINERDGVSQMKLCGSTTLDNEGALVSVDGCISIFLKDYKRIKFDPSGDPMAQILNFRKNSN